MDADAVLEVLHEAAGAVQAALGGVEDWGETGTHPGQHHSDLAADDAAVAVLTAAGLGVLSEESGLTGPDRPVLVALDPLDGSTNASRGIPWFATSLCAVDADGPLAAVVVDLARGACYEATRGGGARLDGQPIGPSPCTSLRHAVVGLSGYPPSWFGWKQYRSLGAVALDLCAVAAGTLDAYVDCSPSAHGAWDYLGGALVCAEAGVGVVDAHGRDLVVLDHDARRTPVAGATAELLAEAVLARHGFGDDPSA